MAGENRTPSHFLELLEQLQREPYTFDFFQAVRLLDCAQPDRPQTGFSRRLNEDTIRIGQEPSSIFAPATLAELDPANDYHPPRLIERFMGLLGPQGPLPSHLTEYAQSRIHHHGDPTFHRFLDLFHHRMVSLFYRAWARVRPTVNFDVGSNDRFGEYVGSVFGLGMTSLMDRDALPDRPKRHFSGLFSGQTKHAEGLLAILRGYFQLSVDLEQFVGQWIELPADCQCRTGLSSASLGQTIAIGSHIWDCQQKFRVILGPLDLQEYYRMLPANVEIIEPDDAAAGSPRHSRLPIVADAVYLNGKVFAHGQQKSSWVEAIAVKDGRFLAVGSNFDVAMLKGSDTELIDLGGAMVLPARYVDPRETEAVAAIGLQVGRADTGDLDEIKTAIRAAAAATPAGTWIQNGNWRPEQLSAGPPKALLDVLAPDHPVCLCDASRTTAWTNTKALELAQIDAMTPDPTDGCVVRYEQSGEVTGVLRGTAIGIVDAAISAAVAQQPNRTDCWARLESRLRHALQQCRHDSQGNQSSGRIALENALVEHLQGAAAAPATSGGSCAIEPGGYADMIVIDQDLSDLVDRGRIDRIRQTRVLQAIFDGEVVESDASRSASPSGTFVRPTCERKSDGVADDPDLAASSSAGSEPRTTERGERHGRQPDASGQASLDSFVALVRNYVGDHLQWDVQLILKKDDTPPLGLGLQGHLGWSTWLLREQVAQDPADLVLDAMAAQRAAGRHVVEKLRYEVVRDWDHQMLGRTRDGKIVRSKTQT